jgi:hypothetical protein
MRATASGAAGGFVVRCTGIPIALKDNIHTTDMPTTGGAARVAGLVPPYEATLTKNLRDAGADHHRQDDDDRAGKLGVGTTMPTNYNSLAGFRLQPLRCAARPRDATFETAARARDRRLELRRRHRAELLGGEHRHRNVELDPQPVQSEHARGNIKPTVGRVSRYA